MRLRSNQPPELITRNGTLYLPRSCDTHDLEFCVNVASKYSPWAATTISDGFLTAAGGHRIGVCGQYIPGSQGITHITSLCIRVARDLPGIASAADKLKGSILIIGSPGSGKTTLLRDLIRRRSDRDQESVSVIDERGELFPVVDGKHTFVTGKHSDVLIGCSKQKGIDLMLRCMGPQTIAVDEITSELDCNALLQARWCGVNILATAHAHSKTDLLNRSVYRPIVSMEAFDHLIILDRDKTWTSERI